MPDLSSVVLLEVSRPIQKNTFKTGEQDQPYLRRSCPESIFAAASANFGRVVTFEHSDFGNKANGVCPIWCGGDFDYRTGGHLILRQLKLVVQFPPGSLILIPSATLKHGNVPVLPHEKRISFTQYSAGGLFRWVHYGLRSWKALEDFDSDWAEAEQALRSTQWKTAIAAYSSLDSLHNDRIEAGLVN